MSNLASTAVTILRQWTDGGTAGKDIVCRQVSLVLTGQGTTANAIPASTMFLSKIEQSTSAVASDNSSVYPTSPSADGTKLLFTNPDQTTDANRTDPADITDTVILVVKGLA
mgnify:CR=1 FL=1